MDLELDLESSELQTEIRQNHHSLSKQAKRMDPVLQGHYSSTILGITEITIKPDICQMVKRGQLDGSKKERTIQFDQFSSAGDFNFKQRSLTMDY
jgi:hypothetical protein